MVGHFEGAVVAVVADAVYFADHPFPAEVFVVAGLDDADELVAERAAKAHVSFEDFEVGVADARGQYFYERLAGFGPGDGLLDDARLSIEN
jgi:hypothetical protein